MKKKYEKPLLNRVSFSYAEQVVAESGSMGTAGNHDGSGKCYQAEIGCTEHIYALFPDRFDG